MSELNSKMERSTQQILNSVKRRRSQSNDRLTGMHLDILADKIVDQCRTAILSIQKSQATSKVSNEFQEQSCEQSNTEADSVCKQLKFDNLRHLDEQPEASPNVQLISKLPTLMNSPQENEIEISKSPYEQQMKRVFGSSEKKEEQHRFDKDPERTPEQTSSSFENQHQTTHDPADSEFTIAPEYKQAYQQIKAITQEKYNSLASDVSNEAK